LLVLAHGLAQRRRRAWGLAVLVLVVAGVLNLLKGLDLAEAAACWALAGALFAARPAFYVGPQSGLGAALRGAALVVGSSLAVALTTLFSASHWAMPGTTWSRALGEIAARAAWASGPLHYRDPFDWVPAGIDLILVGALVGVAYVVFRPLAHTREFPGASARALAADIVRQYGRDTLSSFKLRPDKHYLFGPDGGTFVGYGIEGRTLVVSGDPVGPPDAIPGLIRELCAFCEVRGLRLAAVGASGGFSQLARQAGLRPFYIGDEAVIDTDSFSLEGRRIRKVRQAVARVERAGFRAGLLDVDELAPEMVIRLEELAERWRGDNVERGFSMASHGLSGELARGSVLLLARDSNDSPRGFLHFVACHGRAAASLGLMRRDREGPNGLTEFMVVRALELLRERGIREVSLNFAPFARLIHGPQTVHERMLGRIAVSADRFFQVERLYRFNAKFQPRWEPRYLLYEGRLGLAAAGLAVMWAERQLPKPRLLRRPV
jgi:lysyl-tRNA synthetase class 2